MYSQSEKIFSSSVVLKPSQVDIAKYRKIGEKVLYRSAATIESKEISV